MDHEVEKPERRPRRRAAVVAVAVSLVIHAMLAALVAAWIYDRHREAPDDEPKAAEQDEERLAEVLFEDEPAPDLPDATEEPDTTSVTPDPQPPERPQQPETIEEEKRRIVAVEEVPVEPTEVTPQPPPPDDQRQAVAQPTSNEEVPTDEEFFWSDVDNRAETQTQAEDTVAETEENASRTEREARQRTEDTASSEAREATAEQTRPPVDSTDTRGEDSRTERRQGAEEQSRAQATREGAAPAETRESRAVEDDRRGPRVPQSEQGQVASGSEGTRMLDELSIESRTRQAFESGAGEGETGAGSESVTRRGAVVAESSFDQLFGDETAQGAENLRQQRREASMTGDHQGDWERTREALANYDIAVETGTETQLNTRRNEHASFIHGYHNQLHQRWWDFLAVLNSSPARTDALSDMELATRVEIRVLADGKVDKVRIIRGSGSTYFDAEAVRIQYDIGSVPPPNESIVCDDGSVYLHWTLSRAPGRCGTFHASLHCPAG